MTVRRPRGDIREADLAAGLRHPHIVGIHDRGEYDGQLWISMDYIDGTDAAHLVEGRCPAGMPVDLVVTIIAAVSSALDYAHKKGLLHRDVKPANIMVADLDTDDPSIFLADFGIARPLDDTSGMTTTNLTVGTVSYAAPEQLMGLDIDGRADQYALATKRSSACYPRCQVSMPYAPGWRASVSAAQAIATESRPFCSLTFRWCPRSRIHAA